MEHQRFNITDLNPFLAARSVGCQIYAVQLFPRSISARSIIALFAEKLFANPGNGFVQRLYLEENLLRQRHTNVISGYSKGIKLGAHSGG